MAGFFGGSAVQPTSYDEPVTKKGFFGGAKKSWGSAEETKFNKHWAKSINKRDMRFQEFINIGDWNMTPLVPRTIIQVKPEAKTSADLSSKPVLGFTDYIEVYKRLRSAQTYEEKLEYAFKLVDTDGDGLINEDDLTEFYQCTNGLSDDVCRYHARQHFESKDKITFEEFKELVPRADLASKMDLPMPEQKF